MRDSLGKRRMAGRTWELLKEEDRTDWGGKDWDKWNKSKGRGNENLQLE